MCSVAAWPAMKEGQPMSVLNITNTIKGPGHCGFLEPINGHFRKNLELSIIKNRKIFRPPYK